MPSMSRGELRGGGIRNPYFFTSDRRIRMRILDPKKVRIRGFRMRMRIANPGLNYIFKMSTFLSSQGPYIRNNLP